jgi:hypothetical protein
MWYVQATVRLPTLAALICVSGEKRIPPESWPKVGHSLASAACAAVPAAPVSLLWAKQRPLPATPIATPVRTIFRARAVFMVISYFLLALLVATQ